MEHPGGVAFKLPGLYINILLISASIYFFLPPPFSVNKYSACVEARIWGGGSFRKIIPHILKVVCNNFAYAIKMLIAFEE